MAPQVIHPVAATTGSHVVTGMQDPKEKFYRRFQDEYACELSIRTP